MSGCNHYRTREKNLTKLGFASYGEYLESDLWKGVKDRVMSRDKYCCRRCGKENAYTVHHVTYGQDVLTGDNLGQLFSICRSCHRAIEFDSKGKKLTSNGAISKRASRKHGSRMKKFKPQCVICHRPSRNLGRDDICMRCYRSGAVLRWRKESQLSDAV